MFYGFNRMNIIFNPKGSLYLSLLSSRQKQIRKIVDQSIVFKFKVMDRITDYERIGL